MSDKSIKGLWRSCEASVIYEGTKLTQLAQVATLVPIARVLVGKTSDARTQLTGPKLREKMILSIKIMATPALKNNY